MEENQIIENLRNKITEDNEPLDNSTLDNIDELDEDDEENFSFNFLIKNELGVDIKLESLFGFMVIILSFFFSSVIHLFFLDKYPFILI